MNIRVDDYQRFYRFIFNAAVELWRNTLSSGPSALAQLLRVNWYEVGAVDEWDLADAKAQATLREIFDRDLELKRAYMALAGQMLPGRAQAEVAMEAWKMCFDEFRRWYEQRLDLVEGFRRFHHAVRSSTDFIDVIECGHWKVDLLHRTVLEKGLDTRLAVDMVTTCDTYDVAVLLSGDADNIDLIHSIGLTETRTKCGLIVNHSQIVSFIWSVADQIRDTLKRGK
jgi:uncharacterized LabA/DUF88 family protein